MAPCSGYSHVTLPYKLSFYYYFLTLGINVPEKGLKKLEKMKRLGMSKIPCGHKLAYFHVEEQR